MAASAKPPVHNTPDQQITLGKEKSLHCNGSQMSAVLGLSALLWSVVGAKTHDCYTRKASEIIAEVLKTVAPQSAPELWEAVRRKNEVSKILESVHPGSDLLLAVVESYKQADSLETAGMGRQVRRNFCELRENCNFSSLKTL